MRLKCNWQDMMTSRAEREHLLHLQKQKGAAGCGTMEIVAATNDAFYGDNSSLIVCYLACWRQWQKSDLVGLSIFSIWARTRTCREVLFCPIKGGISCDFVPDKPGLSVCCGQCKEGSSVLTVCPLSCHVQNERQALTAPATAAGTVQRQGE